MGPQALDLVGKQAWAITALSQRLVTVEAVQTTEMGRLMTVTAILQRSFWGRLRWICTGR